ncbi:MAG: hypothetical protein KY469_10080 [Actinobacteria bacterium]|nr:hypothetical protein [Actinomycetota bacterium]
MNEVRVAHGDIGADAASAGSCARAGTGLGLSIVKEYVELHGGAVEVESGDRRTTFPVTLPAGPIT